MNTSTRRLASALTALFLALALALAAAAGAAEAVHYTSESLAEYEKQLDAAEVQQATFNKKLRSIRLTLKDGRHVLVKYPKHAFHEEEAKLKAKHVAVAVLSKTEASKEAKASKPKHHKIRYIVGGAVIVVILLVGAVLLFRRRRERD